MNKYILTDVIFQVLVPNGLAIHNQEPEIKLNIII